MNSVSFLSSESGAVTVDWVVLTAALVGLGLASMAVVSGGVEDLSGDISTDLASLEVGGLFATDAAAGIAWADYSPLANQHGTSWGSGGLDAEGRTWAENTYDGWSAVDDATLMAIYSQAYGYATTGSTSSDFTRTYADYVAVSEQIMVERGLEVPSGHMSASEVRDMF